MSHEHHGPSIAVVDFGGQYAHLIARRIRNLGVFTDILAPDDLAASAQGEVVGIVLSGGPDSVLDQPIDEFADTLHRLGLPVLGICFGHQLLAKSFGGQVARGQAREYGLASVTCDPMSHLFRGLDARQRVWMSHGDHVNRLPEGFAITVSSDSLAIAGFEDSARMLFGLQFHPEVTHTENGTAILDNFVSICTDSRPWTFANIEQEIVRDIRQKAGNDKLFLLVSGGVDSLVSLELCIKAVGNERVHSLHVDTGFMRENESAEVMSYLKDLGYANLCIIDASDMFFAALEGVVDPEEKRRIIGRLFVQVVERHIEEFGLASGWMLVQGTIYPDRIESGATQKADRIKTHHNRVEEIERLLRQGRVVEPIAELYKNEVRELGTKLGSPAHLVNRRPFPGPGLAVRLIGSESEESPHGFDSEDEQLGAIARAFGLESAVLPVRSVGVQGDARTYHHPAVVWTRSSGEPEWPILKHCALQVVNTLQTINRVVFSPREFDKNSVFLRRSYLNRESIARLRLVNTIVEEVVLDIDEIWQIPVVSLPLHDSEGKQVFVIRPVCSTDAMTADIFEMQPALLQEVICRATTIPGVGHLLYDITTKPPATIEWE
jgi:GMP synthase (glutamine-hydrolysing)